MEKSYQTTEIDKETCINRHYDRLESLPESVLSLIEQYTDNIIVVMNNEGNILYVSSSVKRILGYEPNNLLGVHWEDFLAKDVVHNIKKYITDISDDDFTILIDILDEIGKKVKFECKIKKQVLIKEVLYITILKDITIRQEFEEMMIRSEKMSIAGQLTAGIAHEIRNPLTALKGFLQLIQAGVDHKELYYKIMIDEIDKIESITSELLTISKPLTDTKKMEPLNNMISDVIILLKSQAKLRNITLHWTWEEDIYIYCDRSQMKQVFINLIKNAIEASEESGNVYIKVRKTNTIVLIDIIDEGHGIPKDIIHKLDEPFFTTKQSGTGLGLMITKNILDHHVANIEVISNKKKGTTFRIHFPL